MKPMLSALLPILVPACLAGGCVKSRSLQEADGGDAEASSIAIALPPKEKFSADPALQAKLTGHELGIVASEERCKLPSFTARVASTKEWKDDVIAVSIKKACEYAVSFKLGELSTVATPEGSYLLQKVFFMASKKLTKEETSAAGAKVKLVLDLEVTPEGLAAGFKGGVSSDTKDLEIQINAPGQGNAAATVAPGPTAAGAGALPYVVVEVVPSTTENFCKVTACAPASEQRAKDIITGPAASTPCANPFVYKAPKDCKKDYPELGLLNLSLLRKDALKGGEWPPK